MKRRIVVSGVGSVSPLGIGIESTWRRLIQGECGISEIDKSSFNCIVPISLCGSIDKSGKECLVHGSLYSPFIQLALLASDLAIQNSRLKSYDSLNLDSVGVAISSGGIGSITDIVESSHNLKKSVKKLSPFFVPRILSNMASGHVSIRHQFKGPVHSASTACAAGLHAIGDAYNFIRLGYADVIFGFQRDPRCMIKCLLFDAKVFLAGGTESCLDELTISGFHRMKALSMNDNPQTASRPFDANRDGFVIAEGSCVLVLEELEHALRRDAPIIAEVCGYGLSGDGYKATSPPPDGNGAERSMRSALRDAGLHPSDIHYINAHATSTPVGDAAEVKAIESVFGSQLASTSVSSSASSSASASAASTFNPASAPDMVSAMQRSFPLYVSSTKGATGHLLGAAGALEAAFTCLALRDGVIPPTLNLHRPDSEPSAFQHVPHKALTLSNSPGDTRSMYALKNSFGFGGTNASVIFRRFEYPS